MSSALIRWLIPGLCLPLLVACGGGSEPSKPPTLVLTSASSSVGPDQRFELSWSAEHAKSCTASGGWEGPRATSGTAQLGPIISDTTYAMQCTSSSGSVEAQVTIKSVIPTTSYGGNLRAVHAAQQVTLQWNDAFSGETTYFVDRSMTEGRWEQVAQLAGSTQSGALVEYRTVADRLTRFRVRVAYPGEQYLVSTQWSADSLTVDPSRGATITFERPEPFVASYVSADAVGWTPSSVNYEFVGRSWSTHYESGIPPERRFLLDTAGLATGQYTLTATLWPLRDPVGTTTSRIIRVDKSFIRASINSAPGIIDPPVRSFDVSTNGARLVTSVTFRINGVARQVLNEPNASHSCCGDLPVYRWAWDVTQQASGSYTVDAVVRAVDGSETVASQQYVLARHPRVQLASPLLYEVVSSQVRVSGKVIDDVGGVRVVIDVDDVACAVVESPEFDVRCSLAANRPGLHFVHVRVSNSAGLGEFVTRKTLEWPAGETPMERLIQIQDGWIAGAEDGHVLFVDAGRVMLRHPDGQFSDLTPDGEQFTPAAAPPPFSTTPYLHDRRVQLSHGAVAIDGTAGTYLWREGKTELVRDAHEPVLKWPWLLARSAEDLLLLNLETGVDYPIAGPGIAPDQLYCGYDFHANGQTDVDVLFCHGSQPPLSNVGNLFWHSTVTGQRKQLTSDGLYFAPQTDGQRVTFSVAGAQNVAVGDHPLLRAPVGIVGTNEGVDRYAFRDGFLAWEVITYKPEGPKHTGIAVLAPTGVETRLVTATRAYLPELLDLAAGSVLYAEPSGVWRWTAGHSIRLLPELDYAQGNQAGFIDGNSTYVDLKEPGTGASVIFRSK